MKAKYETLEDYLDALDVIKEKVGQETKGLTAQQVKAYFACAALRLEKATGQKVQVRRRKSKVLTHAPRATAASTSNSTLETKKPAP